MVKVKLSSAIQIFGKSPEASLKHGFAQGLNLSVNEMIGQVPF